MKNQIPTIKRIGKEPDKKVFRIIKREGGIDAEIPDGTYLLNAKITIINGQMRYIDDGTWNRI